MTMTNYYGYYQPAGPLITHHHHHHASSSSSTSSKVPPPPSNLPTPTPPPSSAPQPASESSDSEVIITATSGESNPPPLPYRYPPQPYPSYNYQYYPSPPATASLQYPAPSQTHYHQDCYSGPPTYPPTYFHHKTGPYPPPSAAYHRRYGPPPQYYPQEFYTSPPTASGNPPPSSAQQQMIVTAPAGSASSSFPPADSTYPPGPMVDPYPPPPPTYYPYSAGPPPPCYSHSPPTRSLTFIDTAYQSCPCPIQSCPKNVHTGPLTGASKGSLKNHQATPLPPVALALPLEPTGALGPPSPARGSAGMPPPPSPALGTARNPNVGQWGDSPPSVKASVDNKSETGLLAISKMLSESVLVADEDMNCLENTIVAMNIPKTENVKVEVEDMSYLTETFDVKNNRKRRKTIKCIQDVKKQYQELPCTVETAEIKVQPDVQERLSLPVEKNEKTVSPIENSESPVEKQVPLSDNRATVAVKRTKKRKLQESATPESLPKVEKCAKKTKVQACKKKSAKKDKEVTEENIEPAAEITVSKVNNRRKSSKAVERRKSTSSVHEESVVTEDDKKLETTKKKPARVKKGQSKSKVETAVKKQTNKERRNSKSYRGSNKNANSSTKTDDVELEEEDAVSLSGPRKTHLTPKWSNGWSWEGQPFKAMVFITNDANPVMRRCYPAMRHCQGDIIYPSDSILLKSGPRKTDLPFVAKVAAMWDNPEDGEMMVSLLWYYRPEHTEQGRREEDTPDEIFASRHKDINSVACIEDKCFVLTFNEYCRYRKNVKRIEEGIPPPRRIVPILESSTYPRSERQPCGQVASDLVFFCRRVYDFRQKRLLKNPC
uniref:BAH domain-containing protein n=1 Tax=Clastoptera arizonana TaxID=38151 RepID=A0A1B6D7Y1_9HEMI